MDIKTEFNLRTVFALVAELAARPYNLEAIPSKKNLRKSAKITEREVDLAKRWQREGLLFADGLKAVEAAGLMRSSSTVP